MKTIIYLIIIIGWSILQARRKAMREQKRKEALASGIAAASARTSVSATPLGAVSAEENRAATIFDRIASSANTANQSYQNAQQEVPEEIKPLIEQARRTKKKKRDATQSVSTSSSDEQVERLVKDVPSIGMQNYDQVEILRPRFVLDKESIRNYIVTREVLGPPRSRKPYRAGVKDRE